jgi:hypothetical protein
MNPYVIPPEYELPDEDFAPKRPWLAMLVVLAIVCGATLALVASNGTFSPVSVQIGEE